MFLTHYFSSDKLEKSEIGRQIARMGERREVYRFWWVSLSEKDHLGDPGVVGRIILRWIFRKLDVRVWTGSSWLRIGTGAGANLGLGRLGSCLGRQI